jgi:hypothetical protein
MKTSLIPFLFFLCSAAIAQPLPDPFTVLEADSGSQFVDARVTMRDSATADIFYVQARELGNSRLLHAVVSLATEQIIAGPEELPHLSDWTIKFGDIASRGADGWAAITYEESPYWLQTQSNNRTLLLWGSNTITDSMLLDTGVVHFPAPLTGDHSSISFSLCPRPGGGWLTSWIHQGVWFNGSEPEPDLHARVITLDENFFTVADRLFAAGQVGTYGPGSVHVVPWSSDSILALLYSDTYPYLEWVPRLGDIPFAFPIYSEFYPLDFRRTHGGRLLACANGSRIYEIHPAGTSDSLGITDITDYPASIAWHPDFGYALLECYSHAVKLAVVDTFGHVVQPSDTFYDSDANAFIAFSSAAIAPSGRIAVLWGEQDNLSVPCATLKIAWTNWTNYVDASDRDFIFHPSSLRLSSFPNPFNARTEIRFSVPQAGKVELALFDVLGRNVAALADRVYPAGEHSVLFDGSNLASGIYFARLSASHHQTTLKVMLIR